MTGRERVVELEVGIVPEGAVSGAILLKSEYTGFIIFNAMLKDRDTEQLDHGGTAVIELLGCLATRFGYPNDEARPGHPLFGKGLANHGYAILEVLDSTWLDEVKRQNLVHFPHAASWFGARCRHFVITFHDSTFECLSEDIDIQVSTEALVQILARLSSRIATE